VNMKRRAAIVWREGVELLVFGYGFSVDVRALRFMVLDEDRTPESRAYLEAFEHAREFRFAGMLGSPAEREGARPKR
jgi:ribosome-dependent ATPase